MWKFVDQPYLVFETTVHYRIQGERYWNVDLKVRTYDVHSDGGSSQLTVNHYIEKNFRPEETECTEACKGVNLWHLAIWIFKINLNHAFTTVPYSPDVTLLKNRKHIHGNLQRLKVVSYQRRSTCNGWELPYIGLWHTWPATLHLLWCTLSTTTVLTVSPCPYFVCYWSSGGTCYLCNILQISPRGHYTSCTGDFEPRFMTAWIRQRATAWSTITLNAFE